MNMNVQDMKERIEIMPKHYQIEIGKLLIGQNQIVYNENQNGIFINLSNVSYEILEKLQKYIDYVNLQESQLNQTEQQKDELKDLFFK
jgi:hypothetical protein